VDEVDEVLDLTEESIENVSSFSNDVSMDYIYGVGKVGDRIVTLLNLEKLTDIDEEDKQGIRKMSVNFDNLDNIQIDVLREIGNIGSGNAATALAKMLNKRVNMDVPQVKVLQFQEVSDILGGAEIPVVGLLLRVTGDISGSIMFILEKKAAGVLVNILMGKPLMKLLSSMRLRFQL